MPCQVLGITGIQEAGSENERLFKFEQSMLHFLHSLIGADGRDVRDVTIELRYAAHAGDDTGQARIQIAFFIRGNDVGLVNEVCDLLDLSLFDGGLEYSRHTDCDERSAPFECVDTVFFARRLARSRPLETIPFEGKPDAFRICNILLRQGIACALHIIARPCNFDRDDRFTLEHLWGKGDFALAQPEATSEPIRLMKVPPFLMNLRLSSSAPIKDYLANMIGSELAGGYSFVTWRPANIDSTIMQDWMRTSDLQSVSLPVSKAHQLPAVVTEAFNTYSEQEILRAFRLPDRGLPGYKQKYYSRLSVPSDLIATDGILLGYGTTSSSRAELPVLLSRSDRRRHLYILGQTGTGKSTLLLNLILQDIASGAGGCVIDPHGDLINDILGNVDDEVVESGRLVLFDPTNERFKPGLNLLEVTDATSRPQREYIVNELVATFLRLFTEETFGPIAQHYFRNACITLMESEYPGTLVDVPRMFMNEPFRKEVLSRLPTKFGSEFWETEYPKSVMHGEMIPYFTSKFAPIVGSYLMRYILGQERSTVDVTAVMQQRQMLLVPLSKGLIGGLNASLLGSFMVSKVVSAMFARANVPESERSDYYVYVDEFQNFVSQTFGEVLSEARKFSVSLTLSHQFIDQLQVGEKSSIGNKVRQAVFGNVGNMLFFRIGVGDVDSISHVLYGVPKDFPASMVNLENYFAVVKMLSSGQPLDAFTITTPTVYLPLREGDARRRLAERRRQRLAEQFGCPIDDIQPRIDRVEI